MGLFSRKRKGSAQTLRAAPAVAPSAENADALADGALDTLAHALRALGTPPLRLEGEDPAAFRATCEMLARHVLVAAPIERPAKGDARDEAAGAESALGGSGRNWKHIRHFITDRRRAEVSHVDDHVGGLKVAIWDLVTGLQTMAGGGKRAQTRIERSVNALERAAAGDSLGQLRAAVGAAAFQIKNALEEQRKQLETEMAALGEKLADLRAELVEARREMSLDPLTQLNNRGAFDEALVRFVQLACLGAQPLALLMIDLDHFKYVNDTYGHPTGDKVIVATANTISMTFPRKGDFAARYGGEEFAVLLSDVDEAQARPLAERLLDKVRKLRVKTDTADEPIDLSCSIGVAVLGRGEHPKELVARADAALYRAKHDGRDRAVLADPPRINL
ncbi:MAG: hypothetical protein CSA65_00105 [Proteobacteria bacterium]|nr:MAG: hypothetical protein CSB49_01885 [Pseudomonadota bacterium]PIE20045.1 MAG: hypothetical protein CSA65_00105 [Pseudomonadota bacterium]